MRPARLGRPSPAGAWGWLCVVPRPHDVGRAAQRSWTRMRGRAASAKRGAGRRSGTADEATAAMIVPRGWLTPITAGHELRPTSGTPQGVEVAGHRSTAPAHFVRALVPAAVHPTPDCGSRMTGDRTVLRGREGEAPSRYSPGRRPPCPTTPPPTTPPSWPGWASQCAGRRSRFARPAGRLRRWMGS